MKWYTKIIYVHLETGEIITEKDSKKLKLFKSFNYTEIKEIYGSLTGFKTITRVYTDEGRQLDIWNDLQT